MMNLLFGTPFTVSTHSRPKAAGTNFIAWARAFVFQLTAARRRLVNMEARQKGAEAVSTHSRPKAAGMMERLSLSDNNSVSTHSRPKAAGGAAHKIRRKEIVSTHSRPKAAGPAI